MRAAQVEHQLKIALKLARRRSARALSLRAAVTLAELWLEQGRHGQARSLLYEELGSFAELDAVGDAGLPRARALLESAH